MYKYRPKSKGGIMNDHISRKERILTFGVFDMLHFGHVRLFKNIKAMCGAESYLIAAVQDSDYILKYKPTAAVLYTTEERAEMIRELRSVDEVMIYTDVDTSIRTVQFDIFAKGPDQTHQGFQNAIRWCRDNGKRVIEIPRTAGISSSYLKSLNNPL
jgi:cytidyltransferase-like protein